MATISLETLTAQANQLAQTYGYSTVQDMQAAYKTAIGSGSDLAQAEATVRASSFIQNLFLKILYQRVDEAYSMTGYEWMKAIDVSAIEQGNGEEWVLPLITGGNNYTTLPMVPQTTTDPQAVSYKLTMYQNDQRLANWAFQFRKPLTLFEEKYRPVFLSGNLAQFLLSMAATLEKSFEIFKVAKMQEILGQMLSLPADLDTPNLVQMRVTGKATDFLSCFTDEIYPLITEMGFLNSKFNLNAFPAGGTPLSSVKKEDLLMFVNNRTYTRLTGGKLSNVFNQTLVAPGKFISPENIYPMGDLIQYTDENTPIAVLDGKPVMPENTLMVIEKDALKYRQFASRHETQFYAHNLAVQSVKHEWGVFGCLPWKQGFIYTNPALAA